MVDGRLANCEAPPCRPMVETSTPWLYVGYYSIVAHPTPSRALPQGEAKHVSIAKRKLEQWYASLTKVTPLNRGHLWYGQGIPWFRFVCNVAYHRALVGRLLQFSLCIVRLMPRSPVLTMQPMKEANVSAMHSPRSSVGFG